MVHPLFPGRVVTLPPTGNRRVQDISPAGAAILSAGGKEFGLPLA
jgi:hypothetical protein